MPHDRDRLLWHHTWNRSPSLSPILLSPYLIWRGQTPAAIPPALTQNNRSDFSYTCPLGSLKQVASNGTDYTPDRRQVQFRRMGNQNRWGIPGAALVPYFLRALRRDGGIRFSGNSFSILSDK